MRHPDEQHGHIWDDYSEVSAEALRLASVVSRLGLEVVFRPWDDGWVVFNLRGLYAAEEYVREEDAKEAADEAERMCDDAMRDTSKDDYSAEEYEREQQSLEADAYQEYIDDYN